MIDLASFNYTDYFVFSVIILSTIFAAFRGFVGSFLSLIGWGLSAYLAYYFFPELKPYIEVRVKNPLIIFMAGHTILLLTFLIIFGTINLFVTTAVSPMTKGVIDRSMGAAFGITRGGVIVSLIFLVITASISVFHGNIEENETAEENTPSWLKEAATYNFLKFGKATLAEIIPTSFYERIEEVYEDVSKKTMDERFIETTTKKLSEQLSSKQKEQLDHETENSSLTMSQEELETKKAKDLIKAYKAHKNSKGSNVPEDELNRLENIISKRQ